MEARILISARYLLFAGLACARCFGQGAYEKGKAALDDRRYADADRYLGQAELEAPEKTNALALKVKALIHLDRFAEAEACLQAYVKANGETRDGRYLLGYVQFRLNKPQESLATLTAAARLEKPSANDLKIVE